MKRPDKTIRVGHLGRVFEAHLFANENKAYLYDDARRNPVFEYGPINDKDYLALTKEMRKAVRYIMGLERDYHKLVRAGFTPLDATPVPYDKEAKVISSRKDEKLKTVGSKARPAWM